MNRFPPSNLLTRNSLTGFISVTVLVLSAAVTFSFQEQFTPPDDWSGKVVLAELFTGSECPPCLAADLGFEELLRYFPTTCLAVLEYHVRIPLPDPMANEHNWQRLEYYNTRSTPSVFIDGKYLGAAGGPPGSAHAMFNTYRKKIEKQLEDEPAVEIELTGDISDSTIIVSAVVNGREGVEDFRDLRLHIVLIEKELEYMGMNGLPFHQMVVRYMFGGSEGYPVEFSDNRFSAGSEKSLTEISSWILDYLYDLESRLAGPVWPGFSTTMHDIDPGDLMIIAFVQEGRRNRVLQAKVFDLN